MSGLRLRQTISYQYAPLAPEGAGWSILAYRHKLVARKVEAFGGFVYRLWLRPTKATLPGARAFVYELESSHWSRKTMITTLPREAAVAFIRKGACWERMI